jgi:hypothetical protein
MSRLHQLFTHPFTLGIAISEIFTVSEVIVFKNGFPLTILRRLEDIEGRDEMNGFDFELAG